jgi:AraC-like DNA-binding protein
MRSLDKQQLSDIAFEAPLPLSSSANHPAPFSSIERVYESAWPSLHLVALEGASTTTRLSRRRWISLIFVAAGEIILHQPNVSFCCSEGNCLFVPETPALWESSPYSVVCLMFDPRELTAQLKMMSSQNLDWLAAGEWDFSKPSCRKASDGEVEACLLTTLQHLLHVTSEIEMRQPILLTRLGISNQLTLLTALLASPNLNTPLVTEQKEPKEGGVEEVIDELTDYMLTHLSEPLSLSVLEKHSHYSRRSLQYAFRDKYGCTITQWIRSQRLDHAYQALKAGTPGQTVSSIAHACGYRSVSLFSIEFQNRFHIKPSVMLREHKLSD